MTIRTYTPGVSVKLTRLVNRQQSRGATGFAGGLETVDLTPYLGMAGTVETTKDIHEPMGAFSISFADRMHPQFLDSIYGAAEPMDLIEIRASRNPGTFAGADLPLIMRGFVSNVSREEAMGQDGTPTRIVRIAGQDSGKLLNMFRVIFFAETQIQNKDFIDIYRLQAELGISPQIQAVNDFMTTIVKDVVNKKISAMSAFTGEGIAPFAVDASVPDGMVAPQVAANVDNVSIWDIMEIYADKPWNELFVVDQEDGPHVIFRPVPYRDYSSTNLIMNGAQEPGEINMDISDVVSLVTSRTDARVANFFWVPVGLSQLESGQQITNSAFAGGWPIDLEHDANNPTLYGPRMMQGVSNLYPNSLSEPMQMLPQDQRQSAGTDVVSWVHARASALMALNHDNAVFEDMGLTVKGSEDLLAGHYFLLNRGAMQSESYITSVSHHISPLNGWTTTLSTIRGTGYRERSNAATPYLSEKKDGPYS